MSIASPSAAGAAIFDPPRKTLDDLLQELGDVPPHRVRLHPFPGTATESDALRVTNTEHPCELVNGTLVEKPKGLPESFFGALILMFLNAFVLPRRRGIVVPADGMFRMTRGNIREPDVSFTRRERLPNPIPQVGGWCPDLCVEILSPDNSETEMATKRSEYFASGCRRVWEIDPRTRTTVVYTAPEVSTTLAATDTLDGGDVLPGFTLSLAELFAAYDDSIQP